MTKSPIPGSLQINLLFTIRTKQANTQKSVANSNFSKEDIINTQASATHTGPRPVADRSAPHLERSKQSVRQREDQINGGAERDRTADPLLAKQVLSQLSYSPIQRFNRTGLDPNGSSNIQSLKITQNTSPQTQQAQSNGGPGKT